MKKKKFQAMKAKHGWDDVLTTVFCDTISSSEIVPSLQNFHKKKLQQTASAYARCFYQLILE